MNLRPYQQQAVSKINESLGESQTTLAVMPTGTGKTIVFSHLIDRVVSDGGRCMVIAHRDELIRQAWRKIKAVTGIEPEVEMAEYRANLDNSLNGHRCPVVVSSVQTQASGKRMQKFRPEDFDLLIIDEAHHATAPTYRKLIDHFTTNDKCKVVGVTATPDRADEEALGKVFESCAFDYGLVDAINDGWLVPIEQQFVECVDLDFSGVRTTAGDLNSKDLAVVMEAEKNLHSIVAPTLEIVGDRKTLIFAVTVAHAERMAEIINRHTPGSAFCISAGTPRDDRRALLDAYSKGEHQFMVNVGIATEGFDEPSIQVVVMARPTKSRALYAQMIGRGTRPLDECVPFLNDIADEYRRNIILTSDKPSLLVVDFVGNSGRHKLITTADILGGNFSEDAIERAVRKAKSKGGSVDMAAELLQAQREAEEAERQRRKRVVAQAKWKAKVIDPFAVYDIAAPVERGWSRSKPATEKQLGLLRKAKVPEDALNDLTIGQAGKLIDQVVKGWEHGLASFKQRQLLQRFGEDPNVTFREASAKIDEIAKNGWKPIAHEFTS